MLLVTRPDIIWTNLDLCKAIFDHVILKCFLIDVVAKNEPYSETDTGARSTFLTFWVVVFKVLHHDNI